MKKFKLLPSALALLLFGLLFPKATPSATWPHWGGHNHGSPKLTKEHHSVHPKTVHPKVPKNHQHSDAQMRPSETPATTSSN